MVLFQNEQWVYYKMAGDTLKVIKRGDNDTLPEMAHSNDLWLVFSCLTEKRERSVPLPYFFEWGDVV